MKSKVSFKSHPLHPVLVSFPIAFFSASLFFDGLALFLKRPDIWSTGDWLQTAGILFGLLAAIPGILDYKYRVPPESTAKNRAAAHGLLNVFMLLIFIAAWFYRQRPGGHSSLLLYMDLSGVLLMTLSSWLGGTLVYRNQIGVDHRYAHAGKWKEVHFEVSSEPILVAMYDELRTDQMKLIHIGQKRIVLARTLESYVAFDDHCSHRGASLADGTMICGTVQCPWHGSQFDVTNGQVKSGPAQEPLTTYFLEERDGKVFLHYKNA